MIPKDIYICHKNLDDLKHYSVKWSELNPDMNIHLYDDALCVKFLSENYPPIFTEIFNFIQHGPIKSDFWRLCILYVNGGCYVDADIEPFIPLSSYISFDEYFVTCLSFFNNSYNPHFIMCEKHNKIIKRCIDEYLLYYMKKRPYSYDNWSVVHVFNKILKFKINDNKSGEFTVMGKKMRFLKEQNFERDGRQYCNYNGRIVLSNRYQNYKNHNFVSENEVKSHTEIIKNNYLKHKINSIKTNQLRINSIKTNQLRINSTPFNKHRFRLIL